MNEINKEVYDKLTPQKKIIVDTVLSNLNEFDDLWQKGWSMSGAPESGITGKKYRGTNNFYLTLAAITKGYSDNRWVTYKQMQDKGWHFKKDEEGNSLGKNAGAVIVFFELRDKKTKQPFDRHVLDGMTADEKNEYLDKNVFPLRKYYRVFNGDIIEGIPEKEKHEIDITAYNERAENLIGLWSNTESRILYGGSQAYYRRDTDEIHLPKKEDFYSLQEYYATALHEIGHSTGNEKRLNRDMGDGFGTPSYATEELRAEIASMFLGQDLEIATRDKEINNNKAYIKSWIEAIKDNPNVLFEAIADADKISKYVMSRERQREVEPFAIKEETDEYGEPVYTLYMTSEYGQIRQAFNATFCSREELLEEVGKLQQLRFYSDKELKEVSIDELQNISRSNAESKEVKEYAEKPSEEYILPSKIAARAAGAAAVAVDMTGKGIDSLTHLSDRDIVEKASKTKSGEKFISLYNGITIYKNEEKNARSLLARIAMFTSDEEQIMRILQSSGQFKNGKPNGYYEKIIKDEIKFVEGLKGIQPIQPKRSSDNGKGGHFGINAKS